ncbi:uncharacterized protein [Diadema antillarum]|uniref:uncharacterized protein n=1 Tax=Diadema antillarum TaxID=105358 RepID=UPI003A8B8D83
MVLGPTRVCDMLCRKTSPSSVSISRPPPRVHYHCRNISEWLRNGIASLAFLIAAVSTLHVAHASPMWHSTRPPHGSSGTCDHNILQRRIDSLWHSTNDVFENFKRDRPSQDSEDNACVRNLPEIINENHDAVSNIPARYGRYHRDLRRYQSAYEQMEDDEHFLQTESEILRFHEEFDIIQELITNVVHCIERIEGVQTNTRDIEAPTFPSASTPITISLRSRFVQKHFQTYLRSVKTTVQSLIDAQADTHTTRQR